MADALWILVANASHARLFSADARGEDWKLIEEMHHEESRTRPSILLQQPDNPNAGTLYGPQPENEPNARKEIEARRFADQIIRRLEQGVDRNEFDGLAVAAPPEFLGTLRKLLHPRVRARLLLDLNHDYTHLPERELSERIALF